ncbi:hypothetical protein [Acetobacter pasteurianus]|uniref:hypothetical protein n=1 Tax=Acetobacter pasteurianus TaxID=438 RepID=UPI001E62E69D|nr:hypothetical protein [Acetobacter pasteurianus]
MIIFSRLICPSIGLVVHGVAARLGGLAKAERYFSTRATRTTPACAKALLERKGQIRDNDRLDANLIQIQAAIDALPTPRPTD